MNGKSIFWGILGSGMIGGGIYGITKAIQYSRGQDDETEDDDLDYLDETEDNGDDTD